MIEKQEWEEIGRLTKNIRNDMHELRKLSSGLNMRKKEIDPLIRSIRHLDSYRSKAENYMFSKGRVDLNVFYGGDPE